MDKIVLYHGTDARIVEMTKEERQRYLDDCNLVIDALFPICKPLLQWEPVESVLNGQKITGFEYALKRYEKLLKEKGGEYTYINFLEKLTMIDGRNNGSGWYQYHDLYLCSSKRTAFWYAQRSFAGGETGLNAFRLIEGFEIIFADNNYLDSKVLTAMDSVKEFAKEGTERPVIITIEDVDISCISYEDGKPLLEGDIERMLVFRRNRDYKFRYNKAVDLCRCKVEPLSKDLFEKIKEEGEK